MVNKILNQPCIDAQGQYGAKGDGSDATTAIQNAINAAGTWSGLGGTPGIVYLPPGNYTISSTLTFGARTVWLMGAGRASTLITLASGFSVDAISLGTTTTFGQRISGMTIDCRNQTSGNGITIPAAVSQAELEYLRIYQPATRGISVAGEATISYIGIEHIQTYGVYFDTSSAGILAHSYAASNTPANATLVYINGTSEITVDDCDLQADFTATGTYEMQIINSSGCLVAATRFMGGPTIKSGTCLRLSGSDSCAINGSLFWSFGVVGAQFDSSNDNALCGCAFTTRSQNPSYGVRETGTSNGNAITGCEFGPAAGYTVSPITLLGAASKSTGNTQR
jgi:hypothetical protein